MDEGEMVKTTFKNITFETKCIAKSMLDEPE